MARYLAVRGLALVVLELTFIHNPHRRPDQRCHQDHAPSNAPDHAG